MPNLASLINKIQKSYQDLIFAPADRYQFTPPNTIFYSTDQSEPLLLLHEIGHYLTDHYDYSSDIELLRIESAAWRHAKKLCSEFNIKWDEDFAEDRLDSYRDWLHANSLCPGCQLSGYQDKAGLYHCPLCDHSWHSKYIPE
jgi:hypothetical protein